MELSSLIGRRVALRFVAGERDGRPLLTDAVGDLSADGDTLVVVTRGGPVRVARDAVTAVRAVPPPVPRRAPLAAVARLETLCADAWPALVDERLGAWRLRAAGGYTGRANSTLVLGNADRPVPAALAQVQRFAAHHGIVPRASVAAGTPWDRAVTAAGWALDAGYARGPVVSVQVAALPPAGPPAGEVAPAPGPAWWRITGQPDTPAARHVLTAAPDTAFLTLDDRAAVRVAVVEDHAHLSVLAVEPAARRRGLASAVTAAACGWAAEHGARFAVLQVSVANAAAITLYRRLGFTEHHRYRYLVPG